jgi:hypothetical protein
MLDAKGADERKDPLSSLINTDFLSSGRRRAQPSFLDERAAARERSLGSDPCGRGFRSRRPRLLLLFLDSPRRYCDFVFGEIGVTTGYIARSVCRFIASPGSIAAVDNSIRGSSASGRRTWLCAGIVFSRCLIAL